MSIARSGSRLIAACMAAILGSSALAQEAVPEAEQNDVATLPPISPHWGFITNWLRGGIRIIDGDSGKVLGMVHSAQLSDFAVDPRGRFFYVAETMWTRGNRGTRQDLLTVYDAATLKIVSEIPLSGRLLIGNRPLNLTISPDGAHAFVYKFDPAASIQVVDLVKRRLTGEVEVPGCGLAIAGSNTNTVSLCSDGSMATVRYAYEAKATGVPVRSPSFFSADGDPIFDNSFVDRRTGTAIFLSYSGLVYQASLGPGASVEQPWSLQEAGGMPKSSTDPLLVSWLPGGRQPIAVSRVTGRAYALMHMGEYWSQKVPGTELWEIDIASRKVLRRLRLDGAIASVAITQDIKPLLFLNAEDDRLIILDAGSFEQKHSIPNAGNGIVSAAGN